MSEPTSTILIHVEASGLSQSSSDPPAASIRMYPRLDCPVHPPSIHNNDIRSYEPVDVGVNPAGVC